MPNDKKVLIAYYSLSGNTKDVAEAIRSKTGGDIFRIETVQSYPEEYRATTAQAKREINEGFRPELKGKIDNIAQYDIILSVRRTGGEQLRPPSAVFLPIMT